MPSADEKANFNRLRSGPAPLAKIEKLPPLPDDVVKRFPTLVKWQQDLEAWRIKANNAIGGAAG